MMTEADGRQDGNKRAYLGQPDKWRQFDPTLFDALEVVPAKPGQQDLKRFEQTGIIPHAKFFNEYTPDLKTKRVDFHQKCLEALGSASLVFLDPDNGLEIASRAPGRKGSNKFVGYHEIADHYAAGASVFVYQHFPREERPKFLGRISRALRGKLPNAQIWSFETAHVAFVLATRPDHAAGARATIEFVKNHWTPKFFKAVTYHGSSVEKKTEDVDE
jgi:hypothetical protein